MPELSPMARKLRAKAKPPPPKPTEKEEVVESSEEVVEEPQAKPVRKGLPGINIAALIAQVSNKPIEPEALCLLMVGTRQAGKSTAIGTASGNVIHFTTSDEAHSIETARAMSETSYGCTIIPIIIDMMTEDDKGAPLPPSAWRALTPDQAMVKFHNILDSLEATTDVAEQIQWVTVDSLYSFFKRINEKKNIQQIKNVAKNNFRAQEVALKELLELNQKLVLLQKRGVNVVVTCPAAAEQDKSTGLYDQVEPLLEGYRNNLHVVGIFPDICTVGSAVVEDEEGETYSGHFFQFGGNFTKSGKKVSGEDRCINFKPRINGILANETPDFMEADLTKLAQYKREVRSTRKLKGE